MEAGRAILLLCSALASAIVAEARSLKPISPPLEPKSSEKFFHKDYPSDKRPAVGALNFKHPYPVIQDSGEFDSDYVKDENSDNGHWAAQQEYDRLRHKLTHEKKQAAKALEKKQEEEKELEEIMKKHAQAAKEKDEAAAKKTEKKPEEPEVRKSEGWCEWFGRLLPKWWPFSCPTKFEPALGEPDDRFTGVHGAIKDEEKAIDNLKDCESELAKAKAELEKMMKENEEAKKRQSEADAAVERANKEQLEAEKLARGLNETFNKEDAEHAAALAAYLKQKAFVDNLHVKLDAASAKVKAYRDAEDNGPGQNGGVYPTPGKSATISVRAPCTAILLLMATAWHLA